MEQATRGTSFLGLRIVTVEREAQTLRSLGHSTKLLSLSLSLIFRGEYTLFLSILLSLSATGSHGVVFSFQLLVIIVYQKTSQEM